MKEPQPLTVGHVVRATFGTATIVLLVAAFAVGGEPRLFGAAAACGTVWWAWDLLAAHVFGPFGEWVEDALLGGGIGSSDASTRLSLDELVAMLERHLANPTSKQVDLNAAIRLEEIYRTVKKDPDAARRVVQVVRDRYPDAPELARFAAGPDDESGSPARDSRLRPH